MFTGSSKKIPTRSDLSSFFEARSIAVIGTFREGWFGGSVVVKSLLNAGYKGLIYPVNPTHREVHGLRVYTTVGEVNKKIDLALIMVNAQRVPQLLRQCAQKNVKAVIVVADGFAERDQEGARFQREIVNIARLMDIRIIGPNTAGIVNTANGLNICPYDAGYYRLKQGSIAICAQTGVTNPQAFPYHDLRFGVSKICDFGNKCDVDECDLLEYLEEDPKTCVISMYLETVRNGRRFLDIANRVALKKPVLVLKSGRTREGARASASHTGSLAVDDQIFDGACNQAGILRLKKFNDLFEVPKIFTSQPLPKGNRVGIITITGGVGVLSIDEEVRYGLVITKLRHSTSQLLNEIFPNLGEVPVDVGPPAAAIRDFPALYPKIFSAVMADENVDSLFAILWVDPDGKLAEVYTKAYKQIGGMHRKPLVTWLYGPNMTSVFKITQQLEEIGFPVFRDPETAIRALGLSYKFSNNMKSAIS